MTDDPINDIIAALNTSEPGRDETDNLYRLYDLFEGFRSLPDRYRAAPAPRRDTENAPCRWARASAARTGGCATCSGHDSRSAAARLGGKNDA
jgi:hypothetical protein